MPLKRPQVDRLTNAHFKCEATDDIEGDLGSLAPDVERYVVPSPFSIVTDHARVRQFCVKSAGAISPTSNAS